MSSMSFQLVFLFVLHSWFSWIFEVEKHVCHFWTETVKILDALLSLLPPYGSKGHL